MKTQRLVLYTMVIALYTALTLVLGVFSFGPIQVRVSEVLLLLVLFRKDFILPLTVACFVSNLLGVLMGINVFGFLDILCGTLASFLSLYFAYHFKDVLTFNKPILSLLMPVFFNGIIVGAMLAYVMYPPELFLEAFIINATLVGIGEFIAVVILGILLLEPLRKFISTWKV